ncbi:MAG: ATP-binding cassette domain-containing protein [Actinomycetota bacterium]|nr:ATP-binding cassette domain-containing protein [Actinomycetota bacterium]
MPVAATGTAAPLEFRDVTKSFPGMETPALDHLSFEVPAGEVCVLVGPSGCGKTTAMRLVNRMIDMTSGDILIDGQSIKGRQPADLRRAIGYVIQHVGLFPHKNILDNITVVPKLLGWDRKRCAERAEELLDLISLPQEMGSRYPSQLSGGQRQRVGVARALAADPPLMLMDEPFGAIDPINRDRLQNEFLRLQQAIKKTVVFVTHDIDEAIKMGDRIAILREGGDLVQFDTPDRILAEPADDFVARFVGADRGLKRLALTKLDEIDLETATLVREGESVGPEAANGTGNVVLVDNDGRPVGDLRGHQMSAVRAADARPLERTLRSADSLRDALSMMMTDSLRPLLVLDAEGRVAGYVSIDLINDALRRVRGSDSDSDIDLEKTAAT